jgi:hypothetical protein
MAIFVSGCNLGVPAGTGNNLVMIFFVLLTLFEESPLAFGLTRCKTLGGAGLEPRSSRGIWGGREEHDERYELYMVQRLILIVRLEALQRK